MVLGQNPAAESGLAAPETDGNVCYLGLTPKLWAAA
jgi:hypothetical protein